MNTHIRSTATFSKWLSFRIASHNSLYLSFSFNLWLWPRLKLLFSRFSSLSLTLRWSLFTLRLVLLLFATFEWFVFAISFDVLDDEATERESEIEMNRTNGKQKEFARSQFSHKYTLTQYNIYRVCVVGLYVFEIFLKLKNSRHSFAANISFIVGINGKFWAISCISVEA